MLRRRHAGSAGLISGVARDIEDPETQHLGLRALAPLQHRERQDAEERSELRKRTRSRVEALGDGSDFTAFQDFAGISTLDLGFGDEDDGTQYHSIYDDFYWYTHFVDTDFRYGRALSQTAGTAIMRMADADSFRSTTRRRPRPSRNTEADLEKLLKDKQDEFTERNLELEEGVFTATTIRADAIVPPPAEIVPPYMNFAPMKNAIESLKKSAERYSQALSRYASEGSPPIVPKPRCDAINADLLRISRLFLNEKGLPERPWFKNQIYAPGAYTGYGAKPIAAVREYMDEKKWKEAEAQVPQVAQVIEQAAAGIDKAARDIETQLTQSAGKP